MKTRFVALATAVTLGLGSVSAFAQDHHRHGGGGSGWQPQQQQRFEHGRRDWAYNNHYNGPRYYNGGYGYRRDNGDVAGALVLGALAGALVGSASNAYSYNYAPPAQYYAPPATYYNPGYGYYYGP